MKKLIIVVVAVSVVGVVGWVVYKKVAKKLAERKVAQQVSTEKKS